MKKSKSLLIILGLILTCLLFVGCKDILISGTFIFVETIYDFTSESGFYYYPVDITDDPDWDEHKDKIDFVDAVGVEFFITSEEDGDVRFDAYIDRFTNTPISDPEDVPTSTTQIIDGLMVSPGATHITFKESLGFITGVDSLKAYSKIGQFHYYGIASENEGGTFTIDSAKIIVIPSASE